MIIIIIMIIIMIMIMIMIMIIEQGADRNNAVEFGCLMMMMVMEPPLKSSSPGIPPIS